jgi:hypothetical protein
MNGKGLIRCAQRRNRSKILDGTNNDRTIPAFIGMPQADEIWHVTGGSEKKKESSEYRDD